MAHRRRDPFLWILGLLWGLPAAVLGLAWLALPKSLPPGQCEGIGFGCTLTPADTVLLLGFVAAPVLITAGVLAVVVVAVVQTVRSRQVSRPRPPSD